MDEWAVQSLSAGARLLQQCTVEGHAAIDVPDDMRGVSRSRRIRSFRATVGAAGRAAVTSRTAVGAAAGRAAVTRRTTVGRC